MDADSLIICENASFGYEGHIVVRGIQCAVRRGDYLCIVGQNGSGKSTLVKGLLRLLSPLQGKVLFAPDLRRTDIGYLSQQEAAKKDFPAGVKEIVLSGLTGRMGLRPFFTRAEKAAAEESMRRMDVAALKERCFRELSGGQQRRVLICRALCAGSALLVLDEPAAGLDPRASAELYAHLAALNRSGRAIVMVTHDMAAASRYAKTVITL
ncbi:MAG: ATP-binding cassette domain-containing protein [Treponema sp.]|jgi:zinc transport system ATP-binding protein|nr:ATP-binding cassette domain-containing protein [Treponema sp.]